MNKLTIVLLSLSISFEARAVLTQLFVLKAPHHFCPILLVSNVDRIAPTSQGLNVISPSVNEHQIGKLKQVWIGDLGQQTTTDRTPLISDEPRSMLLLYRNRFKFFNNAVIPQAFSRLLAEVPFDRRHVAFIDCEDNETIPRADLSFLQLIDSDVTLQDVYSALDSMRERIYEKYHSSDWLATYWPSPSEVDQAQRYLFSCFQRADVAIAKFKEKTAEADPGATIFSLAKFPLKDEQYPAFKLAFQSLNALDMYFRAVHLSSVVSASDGSAKVHRIVIIADPSHINFLKIFFEETMHQLLGTYGVEDTRLSDTDLELLVLVSSIYQSYALNKLRPSSRDTVVFDSDGLAHYVRRSAVLRQDHATNNEQCCTPCVLF